MLLSSWKVFVMLFFPSALQHITEANALFRLAIIKDDLVQSSSHFEPWMVTVLENITHFPDCPVKPIQLTTLIQIGQRADMNETVLNSINKSLKEFDGFIVVTGNCRIADFIVESIISKTAAPILRLDFLTCTKVHAPTTPITTGKISEDNVERLSLFPLNGICRDSCTSYAIYKWLEYRVCWTSIDQITNRIMDKTLFNAEKELRECCLHNSSVKNRHCFRSKNLLLLPPADNERIGGAEFKLNKLETPLQHLNGKLLLLTSLEQPPFVIFQRNPNGTIKGYRGFCFEIIHALQEIYNFTYTVVSPISDSTYGRKLPNGSWSGMLGMVVNEVVDIGSNPFTVTHSRSKAIDFSVPFYEDPAAILIPPPAEDNRLLACAKPFRWQVWLFLIVFVIALPATIWHLSLWTTVNITMNGKTIKWRRPVLANHYFFVLGVLVGQSGQKVPDVGCSTLFLIGAVWCLSTVVFASAYVGILMSFLRFPKLSPIIFQLEDLPGSRLYWGVQKGAALEALFTETSSGIYKTIGDGFLQRPGDLVNASTDGILRVINGSYAYFEEKSTLEFALEEDYVRSGICRLSIAQHEFFKANFAFALPKSSRLKQSLDKKIMQMTESGLGVYWKKLYWPPSGGKCLHNPKKFDGPKSLGIVDLQGAFFILAIGFISATLLFFAELAFGRFSKSSVTHFQYIINSR